MVLISKLFTSAAASTFGVKFKYGKNKNNNTPWFTKECNKIRKEFNKARDVYKKVKNEVNKNSLNDKAKEY